MIRRSIDGLRGFGVGLRKEFTPKNTDNNTSNDKETIPPWAHTYFHIPKASLAILILHNNTVVLTV